jgi:alpha-tubulin suppressor-like RCC1 family protein
VIVTAGNLHTCAATATGAVYCWGDNNFYQIGNTAVTGSTVPMLVSGI